MPILVPDNAVQYREEFPHMPQLNRGTRFILASLSTAGGQVMENMNCRWCFYGIKPDVCAGMALVLTLWRTLRVVTKWKASVSIGWYRAECWHWRLLPRFCIWRIPSRL